MSFVICMNDYPVATADTEQVASEARAYIQRIYDLVCMASSQYGSKVYIHIHEVPGISTIEDYHDAFIKSGGWQYQHILNNLMHRVEYPLTSTVPILNPEEAVELFKNFRKTYPAIDDFIKRTQDVGWSVKPKDLNYWDKARQLLPKSNCIKGHACIIVNSARIIVSSGYAAGPVTCSPCTRLDVEHNSGDYSECNTIHAEQMAIMRGQFSNLIKGTQMYLVNHLGEPSTPCPTCQKMMDYCGVTIATGEIKMKDTKLNLCSTCSLEIPSCSATFEDVEYGDGTGNDNVIECKHYELDEGIVNGKND